MKTMRWIPLFAIALFLSGCGGTTPSSGGVARCISSADCGQNGLCHKGVCYAKAPCMQSQPDAGWSLTSCSTDSGKQFCAMLANDSANCGACDRMCGSKQFCENGICVPDPFPQR